MYRRWHCTTGFIGGIGILALCASLLLPTPLVAATAINAGQPLAEALGTLRSPGLEFIYSTRTITVQMRVLQAPISTTPLGIAAEILAPHELGLNLAAPGLYTVVPLERVDWDMWLNGSNDDAMSLIQLPSLHLIKHGAADPAKHLMLAIKE